MNICDVFICRGYVLKIVTGAILHRWRLINFNDARVVAYGVGQWRTTRNSFPGWCRKILCCFLLCVISQLKCSESFECGVCGFFAVIGHNK